VVSGGPYATAVRLPTGATHWISGARASVEVLGYQDYSSVAYSAGQNLAVINP
jgi:hypothetical protein